MYFKSAFLGNKREKRSDNAKKPLILLHLEIKQISNFEIKVA
jgi:hypothetical protein